MKIVNYIFLVIFSISLFSCGQSVDKYENVEDMISAAKVSTKSVSLQGLNDLIEANNNLQVIDCREKDAYVSGHIPGSVNIPRGLLEFSGKLSNRRLTTVVFGNKQGSAALAAQTLKKLKYSDCLWVDGSWEDWTAQYPELIETGMPGAVEVEVKVESSGGCGG